VKKAYFDSFQSTGFATNTAKTIQNALAIYHNVHRQHYRSYYYAATATMEMEKCDAKATMGLVPLFDIPIVLPRWLVTKLKFFLHFLPSNTKGQERCSTETRIREERLSTERCSTEARIHSFEDTALQLYSNLEVTFGF